MITCKRLALLALCLCTWNLALADDLTPPPWQRGGPLTTSAEWDFLQGSPITPPDGNSVPTVIGDGGGPGAVPTATAGAGMNWIPFDGTGGWIGPGDMIFDIPNWIDNEPFKLIWIQMTYQDNPATGFPGVTSIIATDPLPTSVAFLGLTDIPFPGTTVPGLRYRLERWEIRPNPDFERIVVTLPADSVLSQVVIDTISVPEPSGLTLASAAAMLACAGVWRRRRARKN